MSRGWFEAECCWESLLGIGELLGVEVPDPAGVAEWGVVVRSESVGLWSDEARDAALCGILERCGCAVCLAARDSVVGRQGGERA